MQQRELQNQLNAIYADYELHRLNLLEELNEMLKEAL
jgi:hypothetical protein